MPILHMETELVRNTGNQLQQTSDSLSGQTQQLRQSVRFLANQWQGSSRDNFIAEIEPLLRQMFDLFDVGITLNQRLQREVDEWEKTGSQLSGSAGDGITSIATTPPSSDTPWYYFLEGQLERLEGEGTFFEYDKRDGKWSGEPEIGIKYALLKEDALFGDPNADGFSAVGGQADLGVSIGEDGVSAGLSGEYYTLKGQYDKVYGDKNLAFTPGVEAKGLTAEGFIGIKDNSIGATIGGTLVSVEGEVGANVAGANVGLTGEVGLKAELGFQIGQKTEVKLPFVTIGFTFGRAKDD